MKTKLPQVLLLAFLMLSFSGFGQNNYWLKSSEQATRSNEKVRRATQPMNYEIFNLNLDRFKNVLQNAPNQASISDSRSNLIMEFPISDGTYQKFRVVEAPIMESELSNRYPSIKTYKAVGVDDPTATMRFSVTQFGLHAMSLSGARSTVYIDPYTEDRNSYIVYDRISLPEDTRDFQCLIEENIDLTSLETDRASRRNDTDDQKLRTYRLALSCTGEYAQIFAGAGTEAEQKANVQAQMTITMNRVNEIYERDLAIRLVFIANNDDVIYLDPATDPWSGEYNTTTAQTLDAVIGVANYDIGHNFNTSGGGSAGCLGCVCSAQSQSNFHKGRAFTGSANPTGDPFDIDYVAHEMGHQFDGWHTMNTCSRSGNGATEVEPASGSSVMGYAGICPTNVQSNSDAHFNYVNIRDISANIQSGVSSTCDVETNLANQPPVADAGPDYTIPKSTAYVLRGEATDPDGVSTLTYNWSQNDPEQAPGGTGAPQPTWQLGPLYRSILPTTSPDRYMPRLEDVLGGNLTPAWEVTPSVARSMEFAFTVRDNGSGFAEGIGQTDADLMTVNVNGTAGPFVVTSQNMTDISLAVGAMETITWDVAGTDANGINVSNVNILLSTDNGLTFDTVLAANTPNDGSETLNLPAGLAAPFCRIMVEAVDNIFYAVNTETFAIGYNVVTTCDTFASADNLNIAIPDGVGGNGNPGPAATHVINVPTSATIDDVTVNVNISHGWINDLIVEIIHPNGTTVSTIFNRECGGEDDINVSFADGLPAFNCSATTGSYSPSTPLDVFAGLDTAGDWTISITDNWDAITGTLNDWSLEFCTTTTELGVDEFAIENFSLYPNPNNGEFTVKLKSHSNADINISVFDIQGRSVFNNSFNNTTDFNQVISLNNVQSGMYLVKVSDGDKETIKKIIVE